MPDPKWFSDDAEWVSGIENAKEADLTNWQLRGLLTKQLGMLKRAHANIAELREIVNSQLLCDGGGSCGQCIHDGEDPGACNWDRDANIVPNRQDPPVEVTNE